MKYQQLLAYPIGTLLLAIALLMGRFLPGSHVVDFLEGLFIGLSIVLNLSFAFKRSRRAICN
ncbi:MAG TPA: hypothetical protein VGK10_05280 [Prolixibacteraceae bacterium]|jgi:pilus assembly protein TadC